jgi:6-phosphofructokinase 1
MAKQSKTKCIGILTSGGDCPGLNAAIRAIVKPALAAGIKVIGILDGFRGLVENRTYPLEDRDVSGILTRGGTILGTSRDKPHKMPMGGKVMDMTAVAVANARKLQLDCLVCLGGGGTQKNAARLMREGLHVMTLPKTIDNDVFGTDITFGFDTAMAIATEAIDRLHTTATSHHRIIVCEIMGHRAGWLALGAGVAGGADVILLPELPYDLQCVGEYLRARRRTGKRFSIVAVAEGARSTRDIEAEKQAKKNGKNGKKNGKKKSKDANGNKLSDSDETRNGLPVVVQKSSEGLSAYHVVQEPKASQIARQIQELAGTEARVTSLGHVQRGGIPTSTDRYLCTLLGTRAAQLLAEGKFNVMVAYRNGVAEPVPLDEVAGKRKLIEPDHPSIESARLVGTCFGDR